MNRAGLVSAAATAAVVGVIFGCFPHLDLEISRVFFDSASGKFIAPHMLEDGVRWPAQMRDASMWIVAALAAPAMIAPVVKFVLPGRRMFMGGRAVLLLAGSLLLAPGVLSNVVLKEHWGRPRPVQVQEFGGAERFVTWWDPRGTCQRNCSFIAGEPSGAFWTLAPAALAPAPVRPLAYAAALMFGAGVGVLRIAYGAHFFTDVVFSGCCTFVIIWIIHGALYRMPAFSDAGIEGTIENLARSMWTGVGRLFARPSRRERGIGPPA
jgi:membrane-associated PAP2 superfamily phosphatase